VPLVAALVVPAESVPAESVPGEESLVVGVPESVVGWPLDVIAPVVRSGFDVA